MPPKFFIYGLRDPRTAEIRYVGQSSNGLDVPRRHGRPAYMRRHSQLYVVRWIASLKRGESNYEIVILQRFETDDKTILNTAEKFWCAVGRGALGRRFTNLTNGGDGMSCTPETRAKLSAIRKAYAATPEGRAKILAMVAARDSAVIARMVEAKKAFCRTPVGRLQTAARIAAAKSPESRAKLAATRRRRIATGEMPKRKLTTEQLSKMLQGQCTPEARAKHRTACKQRAATPEGRTQLSRALAARNANRIRS